MKRAHTLGAIALAAIALTSRGPFARADVPEAPPPATATPTAEPTATPLKPAPHKLVPVSTGAMVKAPLNATLASQIGSWDCTITIPGVKDDERLVVVWSQYGANWIHGSTDVPVYGNRPAHAANFAFGYDSEKKIWISVYTDSLGAYSVSKSTAEPTSKKMTFTDAYPIDASDGPSIVTLGAALATIDSSWTIKGVAHSSHESCEKL